MRRQRSGQRQRRQPLFGILAPEALGHVPHVGLTQRTAIEESGLNEPARRGFLQPCERRLPAARCIQVRVMKWKDGLLNRGEPPLDDSRDRTGGVV